MRQTTLFTKTRREAPKDEVAKNAQLLIRGGYIHKEMAGVYAYMPLGLRVLKNIEQIIREEMNAIGGQEMELTALQEKNVWEKTGRWDDAVVDNWFKTKLKNDTEIGLAYTHEPAIANVMKDYITSYRDLPSYPYQFQTKFRNEKRAKSGIFRGREFLMKDLYSFSKSQEELDAFYEQSIVAYRRIFDRVGLGEKTFLTVASGGTFGTAYSHEFQTLTDAGEDTIYIHKEKKIAINDEVYNEETMKMLGVSKDELVQDKSVEVGNIYKLGTFYSEPLDLKFTTSSGDQQPVIMGSYGIGLGRVMGTIVEVLSDEKGIIWPSAVAPFKAHLIQVSTSEESTARAEDAYAKLSAAIGEVLYDDRDARAGEKFADADLMGMPYQILIGDKNQKDANGEWLCEVKDRKTGEIQHLTVAEVIELLSAK